MAFKFDLLFEVEVPRPWTEGKEAARFHEAMQQAVLADQMGFDTVWIHDQAPRDGRRPVRRHPLARL